MLNILKKFTIFILCIINTSFLHGSSWSHAAQMCDSKVVSEIYATYDFKNNQLVATWQDDSFLPTYSIWDSKTNAWSPPKHISETSSAVRDVQVAFNASSGQLIATWADGQSFYPTYSIWDGTSWSNAKPISSDLASKDGSDSGNVFISEVSHSNQMIATWRNYSNKNPYYAVWDGVCWARSEPISAYIKVASMAEVQTGGDCSNNSQLIAVWQDKDYRTPCYAIWNPERSYLTFEGVVCSDKIMKVNGRNISVAYDNRTHELIATWRSNYDIPWCAILDPNSGKWNNEKICSEYADSEIFAVYDHNQQKLVAIWKNYRRGPLFSVRDSETNEWSPVTYMSESCHVWGDVTATYNWASNEVFVFWVSPDQKPIFAKILR